MSKIGLIIYWINLVVLMFFVITSQAIPNIVIFIAKYVLILVFIGIAIRHIQQKQLDENI